MRGVEAANVEGRIGLGIALRLRLLQHVGEAPPLLLHQREDVIAGAVEDAVDAGDGVALQALAHHLDDGNAAGHRALEIQRDMVLLGERGEARPVMGEQRLVGGDDMLAGRERGLDRLLRHAPLAADQLDEHVDLGISRESDGVLHETKSGEIGVALLLPAFGRESDDLDRAPGARGKLRLARRKQPQETAADGADPRQPKLQCITHGEIRTTDSPWRQWE